MDSVGVNVIETAALGRPFQLGMLYDCRKDELITGVRLWNKEQLQQNISSHSQINTDFHVTASDSIQDKSKLLNIDGGLKLSLLGDLIQVSGAAKYLKDTKTSFKQQRLTLHYHSTSRFEELIVNQLPSEKLPGDDNDIATHVVTAVVYGADACFVFDREVSSDNDKKTVKGEVKLALEKIQSIISVGANADLSVNHNQKNTVKNFTCTFYGDFQLPSNPTSFEDALKVFADLPKLLKEKQELAVPLRVWLYPLDKLHSRASKLQKDISMDLIMKIESVIESLNTTEMQCSDLLKDSPALMFAAFHDKILEMKKNCYMYKMRLMKKLGSLLPDIRGDVMKETALNDLLQEHDASPFRGSDLTDWLKERERESEIIKSVLKRLKDADAQVELNIDAIWMGLEDGNLVSFTFTSLDRSDMLLSKQTGYLSLSAQGESDEKSPDSKQTSWLTPNVIKIMRNNLEIFKNLTKSEDLKPAKFIVSSREMENHPGSCILLYEHGCDGVCFTPPSKPACPITEEVRGQSVVLKVPPSCPATVELRLLYKPKQDTVWTSEPVLKDQHTVTLTDLRAETEYEIKCAALGKLNYTTDSDVIRVTTEQSTWNTAVKGDFHLTGKQKLNLVLCGSDETLKNSLLKLIRGEKMNPSHQKASSGECVRRDVELHGYLVSLVELPALSRLSEEEVMRQSLRCVSLCDPGVHAFLLIVPVGLLTDEDRAEIEKIQRIFYSKEHLIMLFTTELTADGFALEFVKSSPESQSLISRCGGQYRVMGLKEPENPRQIPDLLDYIEKMKTEPYSLQMYVKVQENRAKRETEERLWKMEDKIKELEQKIQLNCRILETSEMTAGLNLVLLGKTGAGKSASGNTILGRQAFISKRSHRSVTRDIAVESGVVYELPVHVYDTPGFFDNEVKEQEIHYQNLFQRCESGPCVFLLVIKADRFTEEERRTVEKIEELLGQKRLKKTWILFTRGDELEDENMTIEEFIDETEPLKRLVQKYEQRYHVFNNKKKEPSDQVKMLFTKILQTYIDIQVGEEMLRLNPLRRKIPENDEPFAPVSRHSSRRIILLGRSGVGKSASGNTIVGQREFNSVMRMNAVTRECSDAHATISGRSVSVVDTHGLFDTQMRPEQLMTEIARSVYISSPGPHAFLIVFPVNMRITEQEMMIPQQIEMMFGQEALKYSIILFTHGDQLRGQSVEELIERNSSLSHLVDQCGGRFHVFNNRDVNNREQVNDLLQKIDSMIEQNGGGHYTNQMFEDALRFRQEEEERRLQEEEQRQEEIERVRKELEGRTRAEM